MDIVRSGIKRELPCKLTEEEMLRIMKVRVAKEAEMDKLVAEAKLDAERRKAQIKDLEDEVRTMRVELHTEHQDRTVTCDEMFERDDKGVGWIVTVRRDIHAEVERRPATAHELTRHIPGTEPSEGSEAGSILDEARAKKGRKGRKVDDEPSDVPGEA